MLRNIGSFIVGMITGNIWNFALVMLNASVFFPMPEGTDMQDPEQMKAYVATLPAHAFLLVLAAHVGQAAVGGWIAARLCKSHPMVLSAIIGVLTALGAAYNQVTLEGPAWMWVDVLLILGAAWFVGNAEIKRRAAAE